MGLASLTLATTVAFTNPVVADRLQAGDPADLFVIETVVDGLTTPSSFAWLPDGRIVIADLSGDVLIAPVGGPAEVIGNIPIGADDALEVGGILNVLVHPDFATNRTLIFHIAGSPPPSTGREEDAHRISAIPLDDDFKLDVMKEKILVTDLRKVSKHDGGALAIGPDGKLYIGSGDNGCLSGTAPEPVYDPSNYFAACLTNANGKILRINLDGSIPADNPLVGKAVTACGERCRSELAGLPKAPAREEIWAWGFRNPWRFWFDPETGNLWVGDVGESTYEELDVIPPGGGKSYGWPWREGARGHARSKCTETDPGAECQDPVYYCAHKSEEGLDGNCRSIIAGAIVDSCQFPEAFRGKYFFGDHTGGWIATLDVNADRSGVIDGSRQIFAKTEGGPVHITLGPDGAPYYAVLGKGGKLQRIAPKNPVRCSSAPQRRDGGHPASGSGGSDGVRDGGSGEAPQQGGDAAAAGGANPGTTDAGAGAGGAAGGAGPGTKDAGAGGIPPGTLTMSNGCNCTIPAEERGAAHAWLSLLAVPVLAARRRSRRA